MVAQVEQAEAVDRQPLELKGEGPEHRGLPFNSPRSSWPSCLGLLTQLLSEQAERVHLAEQPEQSQIPLEPQAPGDLKDQTAELRLLILLHLGWVELPDIKRRQRVDSPREERREKDTAELI